MIVSRFCRSLAGGLLVLASIGCSPDQNPSQEEAVVEAGATANQLDSELRESKLRLIEVAIAAHEFHDAMRRFPQSSESLPVDADPANSFSWRVRILPFLKHTLEDGTQVDYTSLYEQFHFDEPWDSPHNREVARTVPEPYRYASVPDDKTVLMMVHGTGMMSDPNGEAHTTGDFQRTGTDGAVGWYLATEDRARVWTEPSDPIVEVASFAAMINSSQPLVVMGSGRVVEVDEALLQQLSEQLLLR